MAQEKKINKFSFAFFLGALRVFAVQVFIHVDHRRILVVSMILATGITTCGPTPTPAPRISQDKAVEIATSACKIPHLVLVGEPQNIRSQLLSLAEADRLIRSEGETNSYELPLDAPVWLVQMDGELVLVGGPPGPPTEVSQDSSVPTPTPPQPFQGTCKVILDADSGSVLVIRG